MDYKFYVTDIDTRDRFDIENHFGCKYVEFKGISEMGEVKNAYMEDYAEADGTRLYVPVYPTHKATECTLTLLFLGDNALASSQRFYDTMCGRTFEYTDTFRNLYVTIILTKPPKVEQEKLYGGKRYRKISFTFTNIYGKYFKRSQIR